MRAADEKLIINELGPHISEVKNGKAAMRIPADLTSISINSLDYNYYKYSLVCLISGDS